MIEMTHDEAIKWVRARLASGGSIDEAYKAGLIAIDALEKQLAKKVIYSNRHGEGRDLWNKDFFNCPACGRRLRNKQRDPYCGKCGQKLDWEHNESEG